MTVSARERDRIRWRCRRGMLELDLVLAGFVERHLDSLDDTQIDAFISLLMRPDPELLDLVMGRSDGRNVRERELLALMAAQSHNEREPARAGD
ncbi:MAG TPA: succinate dehydrogenase assembly factor 2 [Burkholderiales bacterium]|nr:succinate dehydrogenase assembly factor 2 [Burkholderiales bacterium]